MKRILVVSTYPNLEIIYARQLEELKLQNTFKLDFVRNTQGAREVFELHRPEIAFVAIDLCPGDNFSSWILCFVDSLRRIKYTDTIAISNDPQCNGLLVQSGCAHQCGKNVAIETIHKIISSKHPAKIKQPS